MQSETAVRPYPLLSLIVLGAILALAVQILFSLLGAGVGLGQIPVEDGESTVASAALWGGIFASLTLFVSFLLGGWASTTLAGEIDRKASVLQGAAVWALASLILVLFIGKQVGSALGNALSKASVGLGATAGIRPVVDQINQLNPQIVSHIDLAHGTIVSNVELTPPGKNAPVKAVTGFKKEIKKEMQNPVLEKEAKSAVHDGRLLTARASLAGFAAMVLSAAGAIVGSLVGAARARRAGHRFFSSVATAT